MGRPSDQPLNLKPQFPTVRGKTDSGGRHSMRLRLQGLRKKRQQAAGNACRLLSFFPVGSDKLISSNHFAMTRPSDVEFTALTSEVNWFSSN
jgi:hypothetical protein